jgi:hypothetical protein
MFNWRITKYNPIYRDELGKYKKDEWTSFCEIGKIFNGNMLTSDEYVVVEDTYVGAILAFMDDLGIKSLKVKGLEKKNKKFMPDKAHKLYSEELVNLYISLQDNDVLNVREIECLSRLVLRENLWCKLEKDDIMFVHFGYDYYMYIGIHEICEEAINNIKESGLFVEDFVSPYNDED